MENEIWKDIIIEKNGVVFDFTGLYQVSNLGRVRSLNYNKTGEIKVLKLGKSRGYLVVQLNKNGKGKMFYIHRLVGFAFIPNDDPINKIQINHINEDKTDNRVENLEWCTPSENTNHGTRNERAAEKTAKKNINGKLSKKVVCIETGAVYLSTKDVQRKLGLLRQNISACCRGRQKTAGGYHWKYYTDYLLEINEKNEQLISA